MSKKFEVSGCKRDRKKNNKIVNQILAFLFVFVVIASFLTVIIAFAIKRYVACFSINYTIDSLWIGSVASYFGGTIGGVFSGVFAFLGVFYTIKYYKESDAEKEQASIQPFILATVDSSSHAVKGFTLGTEIQDKTKERRIEVNLKNIGNGFATVLVIHTGFNVGGFNYNKVISVNESASIYFMVDSDELSKGLHFGIQYVDSMRNEYIQEYEIKKKNGIVDIECGYPAHMKRV